MSTQSSCLSHVSHSLAGSHQVSNANKHPAHGDVSTESTAQLCKSIIRLPKLIKLLSVSRSTVYLRLNPNSKYYDASFPKPVRLGVKAMGWVLSDVNAYIEHLPCQGKAH
ncbi:AlpA family phage regulatory protein [Salmonella enterica subsp. enterica]|nr:AlpA family phage regulatory protein [Salmonella enterica subsp. enterica]EBP3343245.1 AlpA family phage regulatory protein [Salmonella enterica subsp. enterica]